MRRSPHITVVEPGRVRSYKRDGGILSTSQKVHTESFCTTIGEENLAGNNVLFSNLYLLG